MRSNRVSLYLFTAFLLIAIRCDSGPDRPIDLLITNATIIDVEQGSLSEPQQVVIDQGRIRSIDPMESSAPVAARETIDAAGNFVLPGLIDVHAHIGDGGLGAQTLADQEQALAQFVRFGVTSIFAPGGGGGNDEQLVEWKRRCGAREILCPNLFGSGDILTSHGSHPITTIWAMDPDVDPEVAHQRGARSIRPDEDVAPYIAQKVQAKVDAIKIIIDDGPGPFYPRPIFAVEKVREIVDAAAEHQLRVFAHVSMPKHVEIAVAGGVHATMHSAEGPLSTELLDTMEKRGVFYVATLALYAGFEDQAHGRREQEPYAIANVSSRAIESLKDDTYWNREIDTIEESEAYMRSIFSNLVAAQRAGVPIALGTDVNNPQVFPGYSVHEELALMVRAGLTPQQALLAATRGGAQFLESANELGAIKPGFRADLLLLEKNPLEEITHSRRIRLAIAGGSLIHDTAEFR